MSKRLRLFLSEYILSMGAYWVCTGFIIAKLTDYFQLPLGVSNLLTSLSSTFLILQPVAVCSTPVCAANAGICCR